MLASLVADGGRDCLSPSGREVRGRALRRLITMAGLQFCLKLMTHRRLGFRIVIFNSSDRSGSSRSFGVQNQEQRDEAVLELFAWHGTLTAPPTFECVLDQLKDICTRMKTEDPPPRRTADWEFVRGVCHARETPVALPFGDLQSGGWDAQAFRQVLVPCAEGPRDIAAFKERARTSPCGLLPDAGPLLFLRWKPAFRPVDDCHPHE